MATNDMRDAHQLIAEIDASTERPRWAWWTPGDARYHTTLINAAPSYSTIGTAVSGTFRALVITIDLYGSRPTSIVIPRPADDDVRYTAREWAHRKHPPAGGAGFARCSPRWGWTLTTDRDITYRSADHHDITAAERDHNTAR